MAITPEFLRLSQIVSPLLGVAQQPQEQEFDPFANMRMETAASDRLNQLLMSQPQRQDPGIGRKILAGLTAFSGNPALVDNALYSPYNRAMEDWKTQLNPAIQAANFERASNINERNLASSIALQKSRDRTLERQIDRDRVLKEQGQERINQADRRMNQADARIEIAREVAKGGTIQTSNRTGKKVMVYRDGTEKELSEKVQNMSAEELAQVQQDFALERIQESGEQARETRKTVPGGSRTSRGDVRFVQDPKDPTKSILVEIEEDENGKRTAKPITFEDQAPVRNQPKTATETESQKAVRINSAALKAKVSNPKLASYIQIKNGKFEGITTPGRFFGPSEQDYQALYQQIYGEPAPPPEQRQQIVQPTQPVQNPAAGSTSQIPPQILSMPKPPAGRLRIWRIRDGKPESATIPVNSLSAAIAEGWAEVK